VANEAEVDLVVSAANALPNLERQLSQIVRTAENGAPEVDLRAGLRVQETVRSLDADLSRVVARAEVDPSNTIDLDAVLEQRRTLRNLSRGLSTAIRAAEAGAPVANVEASLDVGNSLRRMQAQLTAATRVVEAAAPTIEVQAEIDPDTVNEFKVLTREAGNLGGSLGNLTRTLGLTAAGIGAVGVAAGSAAPLIAGLASAVLEIAPAAAVAVSGLVALKLATTTVQVAMIGVGDAIETAFDPEAKPEELEKALKRLAPEARSFITELRDMRGALGEIQQSVQNNVFRNFDTALETLSTALLPQVTTALDSTSKSLNQMALGAVASVLALNETGAFGQALGSATKSLKNLEGVPGNIVTSLGALAAAGGPALERLSAAAAKATNRIAEGLLRSFASGELEASVNRAVDTLAQLGRSIGNIFSGIGNIMDALAGEGDGLFGVLEKVTAAFEDVTATKGFQDAIRALASVVGTVVSTVLPLLSQALQALGPVFQELGPPVEKLIETMGGALGQILEALAPVLETLAVAVGKLIPVFSPLITLFGTLISSILPSLTPLFESFGRVFELIAPFVATLANTLGQFLAPILAALPPIVAAFLTPMETLAAAVLPVLTEVVERLSPTFARLGEAFGRVIEAAAPVLQEFINMGLAIAEELAPTIGPLIELLLDLVEGALTGLALFLEEFVVPALEIVAKLFRGDFQGAITQSQEVVRTFQLKALEFITNLRDKAVGLFNSLAVQAIQAVQNMAGEIGSWIASLVNDAVITISALPDQILGAIGNLGSLLFEAGADIVRGLINGLESQISNLVSTASSIASSVTSTVTGLLGIQSPSTVMKGIGEDTVRGYVLGMQKELPNVIQVVGQMAEAVPGRFTNTPAVNESASRVTLPTVTGRGTNVVNVYIGNELVRQIVNDEFRSVMNQRERLEAHGVRI